MKAKFITLEGIEGTGKSTAIKFISDYLTQKKISHILTREPGGTEIADAIRSILLNNYKEIMQPEVELLLMFASRAQNLAQKIRPALKNNQWVLCDRFTDATYAYQGGARNIDVGKISKLEAMVHDDLQPDLTLLLDAPVEVALSRIKSRNRDRIEQEHNEFFEKVRQTYLQRAKKYANRFKIIDTTGAISNVQKQIAQTLNELIERN